MTSNSLIGQNNQIYTIVSYTVEYSPQFASLFIIFEVDREGLDSSKPLRLIQTPAPDTFATKVLTSNLTAPLELTVTTMAELLPGATYSASFQTATPFVVTVQVGFVASSTSLMLNLNQLTAIQAADVIAGTVIVFRR